MTSFRNFPVFLGRDIVAAFKCFEISVFDIALPPATLKFLDCTTWRKGGENDNGKPTYYPQLVGEMNALSKVCLKQLDIFDEFDITIQLKSFPVYLTWKNVDLKSFVLCLSKGSILSRCKSPPNKLLTFSSVNSWVTRLWTPYTTWWCWPRLAARSTKPQATNPMPASTTPPSIKWGRSILTSCWRCIRRNGATCVTASTSYIWNCSLSESSKSVVLRFDFLCNAIHSFLEIPT